MSSLPHMPEPSLTVSPAVVNQSWQNSTERPEKQQLSMPLTCNWMAPGSGRAAEVLAVADVQLMWCRSIWSPWNVGPQTMHLCAGPPHGRVWAQGTHKSQHYTAREKKKAPAWAWLLFKRKTIAALVEVCARMTSGHFQRHSLFKCFHTPWFDGT